MAGWRRLGGAIALGLALVGGGVPVDAVEMGGLPALEARADDVGKLFRADPGGYEALFAPSFLAAVPPAQLTGIFTAYHRKAGRLTRMRRLPGGDRDHGTFEYGFEKGFTVKAELAVEAGPPFHVTGLLLGNPKPLAKDLAAIAQAIAALPGQATFLAARLGPKGPEALAAHAPDRALAVGSAFKLWILGALVDDVAAGKRRWEQVMTLAPTDKSLPSGRLQEWPDGAPITLHTLASLMISESDNTATDALLHALGRERVEAAMAAMGTQAPARNRPMLSTLEMFKLKAGDPDGKGSAAAWAAMDEAARRKHLAGPVARMPADRVKSWPEPRALDQLEWFASADDLARAMAWLRDHTAKGPAAAGRGVLAINPGLRLDAKAWPYIGYKGGSEPGVLAMAFLLRGADGGWYTLTAAWNDPARPVATEELSGLLERAAELLSEAK